MYEGTNFVDNSVVLGNQNYPSDQGINMQTTGQAYAFLFNVTQAGSAGAAKIQGSPDGANWFDVGYITDASDTISQATESLASTGVKIHFLSNPVARRYRYFRLNVAAVTGSPKATITIFAIT